MKSGLHTRITRITSPKAIKAIELPQRKLRLRLKAQAPTTGFVDGAWWPRSRDLSAELPPLLAVLAVRLERIERVTYNLTVWNPAPRRIVIAGSEVRVEGFRSQHRETVTVIGANGRHRLTLLVVPPETDRDEAHRILMAASHRGNAGGIGALLAPDVLTAVAAPQEAATQLEATQRWDGEGGRVHKRA